VDLINHGCSVHRFSWSEGLFVTTTLGCVRKEARRVTSGLASFG